MSTKKGDATTDRRAHGEGSQRGRGGYYHRRGRGRRHTFSAGAQRKKFEESHYARGGSKEDPLNLNGVDQEEEPMEQVHSEPEESTFIPKNKRDPLGLAKIGRDKKKRNRERDRDRSRSQSPVPGKQPRAGSPTQSSDVKTDSKEVQKGCADKKKEEEETKAAKKVKREHFNRKYCYGNFDRYYGTRLDPGQKDSRLQVLQREWFDRKTVLDIGCNVGFLTLSLAKEFQPRRILGIDIDDHLVGVARKNIRHYCDHTTEFIGKFPASFANQFGPISQMPTTFSTKFPDNVWFRTENYVLECDELLEAVEEEFDVILAFSITKWIHLNFGDDGMRRFFCRAFRHLKPGGRFILEPQPYSTYKKRSGMTETTKENFRKIEFKPGDFEMYLLEVVGFDRVEHLGAPSAKSKGFERPIDVYVKRPPSFLLKGAASGSDIAAVMDSAESVTSMGDEAGSAPHSV